MFLLIASNVFYWLTTKNSELESGWLWKEFGNRNRINYQVAYKQMCCLSTRLCYIIHIDLLNLHVFLPKITQTGY